MTSDPTWSLAYPPPGPVMIFAESQGQRRFLKRTGSLRAAPVKKTIRTSVQMYASKP